jgi:hypothetical protein
MATEAVMPLWLAAAAVAVVAVEPLSRSSLRPPLPYRRAEGSVMPAAAKQSVDARMSAVTISSQDDHKCCTSVKKLVMLN